MSLEARELFYQQNVDRLEHMAFRAIKKGLPRDQFVMVEGGASVYFTEPVPHFKDQ